MRTYELKASPAVRPPGLGQAAGRQGAATGRALAGSMLLLAAIGVWWWLDDEPVAVKPVAVMNMPSPAAAPWGAAVGAGQSVVRQRSPVADALDQNRVPEVDRTFVADSQGQLRLDQRTRNKVEALVALNHGDDLAAAIDEVVAGLPRQAAVRARELVQQYQAYGKAQREAIEPGVVPDSPAAALSQLDTLHRLREQHFGREDAQRLYGEEEAMSRRLLELMQADPDPNASMGEKAERAQARYDAQRRGDVAAESPR